MSKTTPGKRMGKMLRVTQIRSAIGGTHRQRESLRGLGLKRIGASAIVQDNAATRGLIRRVQHLLALEE
ncbi:MAG: 50S ribosomal protein L30 [Deltaproteobacteria bacterium]|nr:50S ribosomal protein L30 [Deltaproteobacteria bacterium]